MQHSEKSPTLLTKKFNTKPTPLFNWWNFVISENPPKIPIYIMQDETRNVTDNVLMAMKEVKPFRSPKRSWDTRNNKLLQKRNCHITS